MSRIDTLRKNLILLSLILALGSVAHAEDVADQYYPTAADQITDIDVMKQDHKKQMQELDAEYKQKMNALDSFYNNKNLNDDAYKNKIMQLRQETADLKEKRMKKRQELDMALLKKSQELQTKEYEKYNQYVIDTKERAEYFAKKADE